jgi:hypothetical protein
MKEVVAEEEERDHVFRDLLFCDIGLGSTTLARRFLDMELGFQYGIFVGFMIPIYSARR